MAIMRQWSRFAGAGIVSCLLLLFFWASLRPRLGISQFPSIHSPYYHHVAGGESSETTSLGEKPYGNGYDGHSSPADINRVTNGTLGFEKVFVVGLPERSDKRDAMVLASALTGFHVEFVDGVRGESVSDKAVPFGITREALWETNLGSWRGHMNAVRRIVEENLHSALIMEDDMDWDVRLQPQLERVAQGVRSIFPSSEPPDSPYGDDWDLLWLGHCGEVFPEMLEENRDRPTEDPGMQYMQRKYIIDNDATVPPKEKVTGLLGNWFKDRTRYVHVTGAPICTFAYALSQRGARKVLFDLSVDHLTGPFDNALAGLCRRAVSSVGVEDQARAGDRGLDMKCLSVTPPVFFHHKAKGSVSGDSDIQTVADGELREKGSTENVMWSVRANLRNMMTGGEMESQYDDK